MQRELSTEHSSSEEHDQLQSDSPLRRALRRFLRHRLALAGSIVLLIVALSAIAAPIVERYDPTELDLRAREQSPSAEHWLGTDRTGRDVWSRTIHAGRVSLSVGLVAVSISTIIGTSLGVLSGYYGGLVDSIIMRFTDVVMTFPAILIILVLVAIVGPSLLNTMLIIGFLNWPRAARIVRSVVLEAREEQYVEAARCIGASNSRIILSHILPNAVAPLTVFVSFGVAAAILLEAGLSFLGLGVQPPTPSWGNMLNAARSVTVMESMPWLWLSPGFMIVICVLAINFVGDGLRDAFDPRSTL